MENELGLVLSFDHDKPDTFQLSAPMLASARSMNALTLGVKYLALAKTACTGTDGGKHSVKTGRKFAFARLMRD